MNLKIDWQLCPLVDIETLGSRLKSTPWTFAQVVKSTAENPEEGLLLYVRIEAWKAQKLLEELGDKSVDKTDEPRMEVKRLEIEYQRNVGIFDEKDAVRSMAMSMEKIFTQLNVLTEKIVEILSHKN